MLFGRWNLSRNHRNFEHLTVVVTLALQKKVLEENLQKGLQNPSVFTFSQGRTKASTSSQWWKSFSLSSLLWFPISLACLRIVHHCHRHLHVWTMKSCAHLDRIPGGVWCHPCACHKVSETKIHIFGCLIWSFCSDEQHHHYIIATLSNRGNVSIKHVRTWRNEMFCWAKFRWMQPNCFVSTCQ